MDAPRERSKKPSGTKAEQLLKQSTFFVDRSLGRALGARLRAAGWTVELHDDHFAEDTPDEDWLVEVGKKGRVVLTKDKAIRRKAHEMQAVIAAGVRLFTLPNGEMNGQEMAETYLSNQARIGRFLKKHPAPFVAVVYKDANIHLCAVSEVDPTQSKEQT